MAPLSKTSQFVIMRFMLIENQEKSLKFPKQYKTTLYIQFFDIFMKYLDSVIVLLVK